MLHDLNEMVGHSLMVCVTYVHEHGPDEHIEFVGGVISVNPLVSVARPGHQEPFALPADPKCFASATPGAYTLPSTGEIVLNPRYQTTWKVRAPKGSTGNPRTQEFRPNKASKQRMKAMPPKPGRS